MPKQRSVGITIFGVLIIVISIFILMWIGGYSPDKQYGDLYWSMPKTILFIGSLILGIGILLRKNWARILFLCQISAYLLFGVAGTWAVWFAGGDLAQIILLYFFPYVFLPFLISFYYLTRPEIKEQFK